MTVKSGALAALLVEARRGGRPIETVPPDLVPATASEAYEVQDAVAPALGAIAGWKVGAASPTAEPNCAPLFAEIVASSPARWPGARFRVRGVEAELAFRFGKTLPPREHPYGADEVWQAIDTLHVAIELVDSRFADFPATDKLLQLADNQNNGGFCYGAPIGPWRSVDFLRQPAGLRVDDREVASAVGGNAAGHPGRLLAWLADHLSRRGRGLAAGDIVTTGSHTGLVHVGPSAVVAARFAGLGEAVLSLESP
ncbi:MAG TPA: fumarylacetoacetate hydrolase family protein [Stellaceae bacterium]|nr:fumarylacetoacetate hydrolase family protein [Stellaceae bacterium]